MTVLECLKTGRDNAVSRDELARLTGMPDRACRREIERLLDRAGCVRAGAVFAGG